MKINIISLFPKYFESPFGETILDRAIKNGLLITNLVDLRHFGVGKHKQVDDKSYGGGPGMVMMPSPIKRALDHVKAKESHVVYLSPQGSLLNASACEKFAKHSDLTLICGHYEGIDQRIIANEVDEEVSIGDYVLTNGCLAALVFVDAVVRFIPGVVGNLESLHYDSFADGVEGCFDWPHFTRPVEFEGHRVPEVLLSGHHEEIDQWRRERALEKTKLVRKDLYKKYLDKKEKGEEL